MSKRTVFSIFLSQILMIFGTASAASVHLAWDPSQEGNVAGYYVYRATAPSGPYTRLNATPIQVPFYSDDNATPGSTYYYAVAAIDGSGAESGYSSKAMAVVGRYEGSTFVARTISNLTVRGGEMVLLNGSIWNPEDRKLTFLWWQPSGQSVSIIGSSRQEASFLAPMGDVTLTFYLTTSDPDGPIATDIIQVSVRKKQ